MIQIFPKARFIAIMLRECLSLPTKSTKLPET